VMVNATNDAWFLDSAELDMHLAMCVFRAVETRVPWVRSTNTGVSAVIDATGKAVAKLTRGGRDRDIAGALKATVPMSNMTSPYVRIGDTFVILLCAGAGVILTVAWRRGRPAAPEPAPKKPGRRRKKKRR